MNNLNILVTMPRHDIFKTFFSERHIKEIEQLGSVEWNMSDKQFTVDELAEKIKDKDICITGWGTPVFEESVIKNCNRLKLVAHTGGSVKPYITDEVYGLGVKVVSGNKVFARSVAEGVIAYALASLRDIPKYSAEVKDGLWCSQFNNKGLLNKKVGIVGYGMISGYVVDMLKAFDCEILVYSGHISDEELQKKSMKKATLEEIFSTCDVISIHSGMTPKNYHMITEELLEKIPDGTLLVNTARGALIDEAALCRVLAKKNINAVLDVFEQEPLPQSSPLLELDNVILMPHMAGPTIDRRLNVTDSVISDIKRFLENKEMYCEISRAYASTMSAY